MKYKQIERMFWKNDKAVYCEGRKIRGANPKTFEVIGDWWAKDDKHAYYGMYVLRKSDPTSFVRLNALYAKDKNFAYGAYGHIVKDADSETFEVIDAGIPTSKNFTFKQLGNAGYAKDKSNVYYYVATEGRPTIIKGANPQTFISLGNEYGRDDKNVFCEKKKIQGANAHLWRYLGWWYSMDNKRIYFRNKAIPDADIESFILLESFGGFAKDKNSYYINGVVSDKSLYIKKLEKDIENCKWAISTVKNGEFDSLHLMHTYDSFMPPKED
jgi:hypothetical protein